MKFGKLTFVKATGEIRSRYRIGLFLCDCGGQTEVRISRVKSGDKRSCGCIRRERFLTHGMRRSPEYTSWRAMHDRCRQPTHKDYAIYGGRGITVCERWRKFENFYSDMGLRPTGFDLHRIKNDGIYEPRNCIWVSKEEHTRLHNEARR